MPTKPRAPFMCTKGVSYGYKWFGTRMQGDISTTKPGGVMAVPMLGFDLALV